MRRLTIWVRQASATQLVAIGVVVAAAFVAANVAASLDTGGTRRRQLGLEAERPIEAVGVGVDKQLLGVEPVATPGIVGTVGAKAVAGTGAEPGNESAEDVVLLARQHEAGGLPLATLVEEAKGNPLGVLRADGDVDADLLHRDASRLGRAGGQGKTRGLYAVPPPASER